KRNPTHRARGVDRGAIEHLVRRRADHRDRGERAIGRDPDLELHRARETALARDDRIAERFLDAVPDARVVRRVLTADARARAAPRARRNSGNAAGPGATAASG